MELASAPIDDDEPAEALENQSSVSANRTAWMDQLADDRILNRDYISQVRRPAQVIEASSERLTLATDSAGNRRMRYELDIVQAPLQGRWRHMRQQHQMPQLERGNADDVDNPVEGSASASNLEWTDQ